VGGRQYRLGFVFVERESARLLASGYDGRMHACLLWGRPVCRIGGEPLQSPAQGSLSLRWDR